MTNKYLKSVLDYLEFILKSNEEYTQELRDPDSISLVPGILWGTFSILIRFFNHIEKVEKKEVIVFVEGLFEKYPKVVDEISILKQALEKLKSLEFLA